MRLVALVAFLAVALAACTGVDSAQQPVVLDEFSVGVPSIDGSRSELSIRNDGEFSHTLVIADEAGTVLLATEPIEPGDVASVDVDLDPGRYQFSCRIVVGDGEGGISDHFELGMVADVEIET